MCIVLVKRVMAEGLFFLHILDLAETPPIRFRKESTRETQPSAIYVRPADKVNLNLLDGHHMIGSYGSYCLTRHSAGCTQ